MDLYNKIKSQVDALEADAKAFYEKGNKSAGTRLRAGMQTLKVMAQDLRLDVIQKNNS